MTFLQQHLLPAVGLGHQPTHHDLLLLGIEYQQAVLVGAQFLCLRTLPGLLLILVVGGPVGVDLRFEVELANKPPIGAPSSDDGGPLVLMGPIKVVPAEKVAFALRQLVFDWREILHFSELILFITVGDIH